MKMPRRVQRLALSLPLLVLAAILWPLNKHRLNQTLYLVAEAPKPGQVAQLLVRGADANFKNKYGYTPLHQAALASPYLDNTNTIKQLVAAGGNVNDSNEDGIAPLHYAIMVGNILSVRTLVQAGANVNARSKRFGVPLSEAMMALRQSERNAQNNEPLREIVRFLKLYGAKSNPKRPLPNR